MNVGESEKYASTQDLSLVLWHTDQEYLGMSHHAMLFTRLSSFNNLTTTEQILWDSTVQWPGGDIFGPRRWHDILTCGNVIICRGLEITYLCCVSRFYVAIYIFNVQSCTKCWSYGYIWPILFLWWTLNFLPTFDVVNQWQIIYFSTFHDKYTSLNPYLIVHGSIQHLPISDPDDWGRWFGIVRVTCQIEGVASSQAHHRSSGDDWVFRWNYTRRKRKIMLGDLPRYQVCTQDFEISIWTSTWSPELYDFLLGNARLTQHIKVSESLPVPAH